MALDIDVRDPHKVKCGQRLRATRRALGYATIRSLANDLDEPEDNLSNWERGVSLVPTQVIHKLKRLKGVTADWIYLGDPAGLPHDLALRALREMEASANDDD